MMTHRESLTQIGLRAEKNVAKHLLGRMVGRAAWWPTFRKWTIWKATNAGHNCNVYGHLLKEEVVSVQKRLLCTSGEDGISNLVCETVGGAYKTPSCCTPFQQTAPRAVESSTLSRLPKPKQTEEQKTMADPVPRKRAFWLFCCESLRRLTSRRWRWRQALSTLERLLEPRGQPIFQIDFNQDFSGTLEPESASRPFAQIEKFCFPGLSVPRNAGYYFGQRSERWRARLRLDICGSKAGIR